MQADGVEYKKTISDDPVWYTEGLTREYGIWRCVYK